MPDAVFIGFDFGYKRIGMAIGQRLTYSASPLATVQAQLGIPNWKDIDKVLHQWNPQALIVGLPTCIDNSKQYTTAAAQRFAQELENRYHLPVYLVDERLSTKQARSDMFAKGGYKKINKAEIDSIAACIILEQWLNYP